jgi:hypothetical protein
MLVSDHHLGAGQLERLAGPFRVGGNPSFGRSIAGAISAQ